MHIPENKIDNRGKTSVEGVHHFPTAGAAVYKMMTLSVYTINWRCIESQGVFVTRPSTAKTCPERKHCADLPIYSLVSITVKIMSYPMPHPSPDSHSRLSDGMCHPVRQYVLPVTLPVTSAAATCTQGRVVGLAGLPPAPQVCDSRQSHRHVI